MSYERPLEDVGSERLVEEARMLEGYGMASKKIGSQWVSLKDISYFLNLSTRTILGYYKFCSDARNNRFDKPPLPCYYKDSPRLAPRLWLRSEIFMIRDFNEWVVECRRQGIYLGLTKYRKNL